MNHKIKLIKLKSNNINTKISWQFCVVGYLRFLFCSYLTGSYTLSYIFAHNIWEKNQNNWKILRFDSEEIFCKVELQTVRFKHTKWFKLLLNIENGRYIKWKTRLDLFCLSLLVCLKWIIMLDHYISTTGELFTGSYLICLSIIMIDILTILI